MSKRRDGDYLGDIQEAIQRIIAYTADLSFEKYCVASISMASISNIGWCFL